MAEIASPKFKAVYEASDRLADLLWHIQVPQWLRREGDEAYESHCLRVRSYTELVADDCPDGEEARSNYRQVREYKRELRRSLKRIDEATSELSATLEVANVREALRKVNGSVVRLARLPSHSHSEALLELAWAYISELRWVAWKDDPNDKPPIVSHRSHELAEEPRFTRLFPCIICELSTEPIFFTGDVMISIEKEIHAATDIDVNFPTDPWSVDMLALFESRGGHLTDNEKDIYEIVKSRGRLMSAAEIESALADKYGDAKTGSAGNSLAFLTRCTLLTKGPGGRGYQIAGGIRSEKSNAVVQVVCPTDEDEGDCRRVH